MSARRDYALVTGAYWVFTLTDGALRMLVLLFLHGLGHSPLTIASLFLFYEFFGVITNWAGGRIGARYGLKSTLFAGLVLQVLACSLLGWRAHELTLSLALVAQGISGIAKDLTKMSAKSYIKFVVPKGDEGRLLRLVALLTGSKNTLKGVGFFLGGYLLDAVGFAEANWGMAAVLTLALLLCVLGLPSATGKSTRKVSALSILSSDSRINWLAGARLFLFGSRDAWFVLALPLFLIMELDWSQFIVGAFMALWIIFYGFIQARAPAWVCGSKSRRATPGAHELMRWTAMLLLPITALLAALHGGLEPGGSLVVALSVFAAVFASCSAIHSYLIVSYASDDEMALSMGFYYMANATGRLGGTLLSGALFQWAGMGLSGLSACLLASLALVIAATAMTARLARVTDAAPA